MPPSASPGRLYVVPGDIARLSAHAIACSCSDAGSLGHAGLALREAFPTFKRWRNFENSPGRAVRIGHCEWAFLTTDSPTRPAGVVVTAATGGRPLRAGSDGEVDDWKTRAAGKGAVACALEHARGIFPNERLLIALPLFRTGAARAADYPYGAARAQLQGMNEALKSWSGQNPGDAGADLALVCYTPEHYQAVAQARRDLGLAPALRPEAQVPPELLRSVREGRCVFFVGAGMSRGSGLPSWAELVAELAREVGISDGEVEENAANTDFFLDVAQMFRDRAGSDALEEIVSRKFTARLGGARPSPAHFWLASLGPRHIVTTNYDDLLEEALESLRLLPATVCREGDVARASRGGTHIVKMHGDARDPSGTIVLGRDDYDSFFDRRPAMAALLQGLMLNQTFVFLGYSLRDPNFRQIYHRIGVMLPNDQLVAYATAVGPLSPLQASGWARKRIEPLAFSDERELWDFLDALCEQATGDERLFLWPETRGASVSASRAVEDACKYLDQAGQAIIEAAASPRGLDSTQAAQMARALEFLISCGWRPPAGARHSQVFNGFEARSLALRSLAASIATDSQEREAARALLLSALADSRSAHEARRVREEIEELDREARAQKSKGEE